MGNTLYTVSLGGICSTNYSYPFGSLLPGRSLNPTNYRYSYQNQEKDNETGYHNFQLRQYTSLLGRWMTPDPYGQHWSPYLAMSNNPVSFIDPDGGEDGLYGSIPDGPTSSIDPVTGEVMMNAGDVGEVTIEAERIPKTIYTGSLNDMEGRGSRSNNSYATIAKDIANTLYGKGAMLHDRFVETRHNAQTRVANSLSNAKNTIDRLPEKILYPIAKPVDKIYYQAQGNDEMAGWTHEEGLKNRGIPVMGATLSALSGGLTIAAEGIVFSVGGIINIALFGNSLDDISGGFTNEGHTLSQKLTNDSPILNNSKQILTTVSFMQNMHKIYNYSAIDNVNNLNNIVGLTGDGLSIYDIYNKEVKK